MPKSKRAKALSLTQVTKKTRENKDKLFTNIRACIPQYAYCLVFSVDNMRNNHLKEVRHELKDSRYAFPLLFASQILRSPAFSFFLGNFLLIPGGHHRTEYSSARPSSWLEPSAAPRRRHRRPAVHRLAPHLAGQVGLLFTHRDPATVRVQLDGFRRADFARAGAVAPRAFALPAGTVRYRASYGRAHEAEEDEGEAGVEEADADDDDEPPPPRVTRPELRRLGVPTRLVRGRIVLGTDGGGGSGPCCRCWGGGGTRRRARRCRWRATAATRCAGPGRCWTAARRGCSRCSACT